MKVLRGTCLCEAVRFEAEDNFEQFHLCHCDQCKKISGGAHVSNLFLTPSRFTWLSGKQQINQYDVPGRNISNAFCKHCGSPVPYLSSSKRWVIVPAGSLDSSPSLAPQDHIFVKEKATWYKNIRGIKQYSGFPE
ncbi:aldehyde-activating protein [Agarivorans sp. Toyoura001]|uniref:GFA family protein n=1 Tax=Agarivorans sp. Toyoura001 TaxID=2283141 RepID=UPI0010F3B6D1|nr:GFA family protein [Agarivorans sp. Toyoura001]GDY25761.1 aldehyde-activating protein [Agarivorans sp. Toyoura001]